VVFKKMLNRIAPMIGIILGPIPLHDFITGISWSPSNVRKLLFQVGRAKSVKISYEEDTTTLIQAGRFTDPNVTSCMNTVQQIVLDRSLLAAEPYLTAQAMTDPRISRILCVLGEKGIQLNGKLISCLLCSHHVGYSVLNQKSYLRYLGIIGQVGLGLLMEYPAIAWRRKRSEYMSSPRRLPRVFTA